MIQKYCKENLGQLSEMLEKISHEAYVHQSALLSGASIGQHMRHILEFYICLLDGIPNAEINYDNRKRDISIELSASNAHATIGLICKNLDLLKTDRGVILCGNFCTETAEEDRISSSLYREFAYCLEHSIHHQALIKVGLIELNNDQIIPANFGVAPATIRNNNICVQ